MKFSFRKHIPEFGVIKETRGWKEKFSYFSVGCNIKKKSKPKNS
jgi:hypothetical protein